MSLHSLYCADVPLRNCSLSYLSRGVLLKYITATLHKLHWLPVHYRVLFRVATLMYDVFHYRCPAYLHNLVTFTESDSARSRLRSSTTRFAVTVSTRTKLGSCTFSVVEQFTVCTSAHQQNVLIHCICCLLYTSPSPRD